MSLTGRLELTHPIIVALERPVASDILRIADLLCGPSIGARKFDNCLFAALSKF